MLKNRVVEYPNRVTLKDTEGNVTGPFTIERDEGEVTEEGTPLTAENLNSEISETVDRELDAITGAVDIDAASNVHFRNIQGGRASVKVKAAKQTTTVKVKFTQAFTKVPNVALTPAVTSPASCSVGVSSVTTTGFTINLYRSTKTTTTVHWLAFV